MTVLTNPARRAFNWKNVAKYGRFTVDSRFGGGTARVTDEATGRVLKTFCSDGTTKALNFAWKKFTSGS
jgi:hypothetical protein